MKQEEKEKNHLCTYLHLQFDATISFHVFLSLFVICSLFSAHHQPPFFLLISCSFSTLFLLVGFIVWLKQASLRCFFLIFFPFHFCCFHRSCLLPEEERKRRSTLATFAVFVVYVEKQDKVHGVFLIVHFATIIP